MKKFLLKSFFTIMLIFMVVTAFSQKSQPLRVEIEAKRNSDNYNIVPLGKDGLIMFYESDEKSKGKKMWEFTKYNTELKEDWTQEIPIPVSSSIIKYYLDEKKNTLYVLLGSIKLTRSTAFLSSTKVSGSFQIVDINTQKGTNTTIQGKFPTTLSITDFIVVDNKASIMGLTCPNIMDACLQGCLTMTCIPAFTGLTVFKYKSFIINDDLENGKFTTIPMKYKGNTLILSSDTANDNIPYIKTFIRNKPSAKEINHYMNDYSEDGQLIKTTKLKSTSGKVISSAKFEKISKDEGLMIGTYSTRKKKGFSFNPASNEATGMSTISEGIYFSKFNGEEQDYIKFYPFSKFENFLSYLNKGTEKVIKKKQSKAEKKGKELIFNYNILTHKIIKKNNEYILIGEAYYPEYQTTCTTTYDVKGMPTTRCTSVFIGFRYTHAVVAAFDKEGELLWDNCFPIEDILTYNLKERVKVMINDNDIILAYSYGGYIKSQIIENDKVVQGKENTQIETNYENDKVKKNWNSDMDFWYDNYFLTWGYEKIKNKEKGNKEKRTVFYFNKIGLQ